MCEECKADWPTNGAQCQACGNRTRISFSAEREFDLAQAQQFVGMWLGHNIPDTDLADRALTLCEEAGEVARCVSKMRQGIRGTKEQWMAKLHEELGDVFVTTLAACVVAGFNATEVMEAALAKISKIDLQVDRIQQGVEGRG